MQLALRRRVLPPDTLSAAPRAAALRGLAATSRLGHGGAAPSWTVAPLLQDAGAGAACMLDR